MASDIPWTKIKAMSFDIYGTLIDWETGIVDAARSTAMAPYLPESRTGLLQMVESNEKAVQKQHPSWKQSDVVAETMRRFAHDTQMVETGRLTPDQVDEAAGHCGAAIGHYPAFPDTVAAIQKLASRYKLIPLSNVDKASFSQTLAGPLSGCDFAAIYTAQDIGSYKPDPRNFQYLIDHVKSDFCLEPDELCHTAQSLFHDHAPAKAIGLPYHVWVDRGGIMGQDVKGESGPETFGYKLKVNTLGELAEIVEKAFEAS